MGSFNAWSFNPFGLCALSDDVVAIACGTCGLRALSLKSAPLSPRDLCALEDVKRVAFVAHTQTLLLAAFGDAHNCCYVVSLRRRGNDWVEVQRLRTEIEPFYLNELVACDRRGLLGDDGRNRLYVFDVSAEHSFRPVGSVVSEKGFQYFAATRLDADILIAFSQYFKVVSLNRLTAELRLELLSHIELNDPRHLLFRGDVLLVENRNDDGDTFTSEIV